MTGWLGDWTTVWLDDWMNGWLDEWMTGWLPGWQAKHPPGFYWPQSVGTFHGCLPYCICIVTRGGINRTALSTVLHCTVCTTLLHCPLYHIVHRTSLNHTALYFRSIVALLNLRIKLSSGKHIVHCLLYCTVLYCSTEKGQRIKAWEPNGQPFLFSKYKTYICWAKLLKRCPHLDLKFIKWKRKKIYISEKRVNKK